jgi:hypothetical protein
VLVRQVEGIPGELDAAAAVALHEVGILVAYMFATPLGLAICPVENPRCCPERKLTGDLPDEIGGDVGERHFREYETSNELIVQLPSVAATKWSPRILEVLKLSTTKLNSHENCPGCGFA